MAKIVRLIPGGNDEVVIRTSINEDSIETRLTTDNGSIKSVTLKTHPYINDIEELKGHLEGVNQTLHNSYQIEDKMTLEEYLTSISMELIRFMQKMLYNRGI